MTSPWIVVTGLDGSGKTHVVDRLADATGFKRLHIPHQDFVRSCLARSGDGSQFGDVHTDRLLFALDARLTNYDIRQWRHEGIGIVSQRGWPDNFVFGMLQHFSYEATDALLRPTELEKPSCLVHMIAEPAAAFDRIREDPDRDKYETADFLVPQHRETLRLFEEIASRNPALRAFHDVPAVLVDSTGRSYDDVYGEVLAFLATALPGLPFAGDVPGRS